MYHRNGYPTSVQAGDIIEFSPGEHCIRIYRTTTESRDESVLLRWFNLGRRDGCFFFDFVNDSDFHQLVAILANVLNLAYQIIPDSKDGPQCLFIEKLV